MAMILKKVWESMLSRSGSTSSSDRGSSDFPARPFSMGAFDQLPTDVFLQILRMIGPRDAAKARAVCWAWKTLASDNMLWIFFLQNGKEPCDSVVFAESHLRFGFRSTMYLDPLSEPSFMHIYAQRENVPGTVIIDGGSGYCKYGWSKYSSPSGRCATFLEFGNIESPMYSRLRHFFSTIYSRMQVKASSQPIIVSIPICNSDDTESARASRRQLREAIYTVLSDLNAPAICAVDQAVLALYASKRTSGVVVNIGFHVTSVVPILRGKVMREVGVEIVGQGALKVTGFLRELMQQRNIAFESLYTVRTLKEKLCYVAADYDAELRKDNSASFEVAGEGWFTLSKERFQATEILFQPHIGGVNIFHGIRAAAYPQTVKSANTAALQQMDESSSSTQINNAFTALGIHESAMPQSLKFIMGNINHIVNTQLGQDNYPMWRSQTLKLLRANDFEGFLDGSTPCPPKLHTNTLGNPEINPAYKMWRMIDQNLASALCSTISPPILPYVINLDYAQEIWTTVERRLQSTNRSRTMQLKNELHNVSMKNQTLTQYITQIKGIVDNLAAANVHLDTEDIILYTLNGLPSQFQAFRTFIRNQLTPLSIDDFYALICSEDINLTKENRESQSHSSVPLDISSTALSAQRGRARSNFNRSRGRWTSSSRGRSNYSSSQPRSVPVQCQICTKFGHTASSCWHRLNTNYVPQPPPNQTALQASTSDSHSTWLLDSGATNHLTPNYELLQQP